MLTTPTIDSNKLVQSIYQLMDIADKELLSSPKGFIRLESSKGYPRFYYYKNRSDTKGKYMSAEFLYCGQKNRGIPIIGCLYDKTI